MRTSRDPASVFTVLLNDEILIFLIFAAVLCFKQLDNLIAPLLRLMSFKERTNSLHICGKTLRPYAL